MAEKASLLQALKNDMRSKLFIFVLPLVSLLLNAITSSSLEKLGSELLWWGVVMVIFIMGAIVDNPLKLYQKYKQLKMELSNDKG